MRKSEAIRLRRHIETAVQSLSDSDALEAVTLYQEWATGYTYAAGYKVQRGGKLWRCLQAHTSQADWTPDKTPALWAVVSKGQTGTVDDPIDAARGMEYTYGLYYKDPDDGKTYICERTGEPSGGTVILQFLPHELIGLYFEEVT